VFLTISTVIEFLSLGAESPPWWNYPGLELWKFVNLLIFIACALYLLRRRIREGLRSRREEIKRELLTAREEKDRALAKLAEIEARFARLDEEVLQIKKKARAEADAANARISAATEAEIAKMREQSRREIESAGKAARLELRKFAAQESVRLAEEILKREMGPEDDARLTRLNVNELGRAQH
jgi:F0F1-type ATP synthase membrane subunit b/b'